MPQSFQRKPTKKTQTKVRIKKGSMTLHLQTSTKVEAKQAMCVPNKIIESIAKRNGMKSSDMASLTYTQVQQLHGVGKKTAQLICDKYDIDPVKPKKHVLLVDKEGKDRIVLYRREKGKRNKRVIWDFPDAGLVPTSNERDMGEFRFYHEEISIIACTVEDCPEESAYFKVIHVPDLVSQSANGTLPVHDRVLKYLEQRAMSFDHVFSERWT